MVVQSQKYMYICDIDFGQNGGVSGSVFKQKFARCALTILYSTYSTVGQSIASLSASR